MINSLYKQTNSFIEECKRNQNSISFFDERLEQLEETLSYVEKDIIASSADEKAMKIDAFRGYLAQYLDLINVCYKLKEQKNKSQTPIKEKEYLQLLQFLAFFYERQNAMRYNDGLEGQVINLYKILHAVNIFYQELFEIAEELIPQNLLPRKKMRRESVESYKEYVQKFYEELRENHVNSFLENLMNNLVSSNEQEKLLESEEKKADDIVFESNDFVLESLEDNLETKNKEEVQIKENEVIENDDIIFEPIRESIAPTVDTQDIQVPTFLKKYMDMAQVHIDESNANNRGKLVAKRSRDLAIYKEKLYILMDQYDQYQTNNISLSEETLAYQNVIAKEINRLQRITSRDINNIQIDLNIPDKDLSLQEIFTCLVNGRQFDEIRPNFYEKVYPTLKVEQKELNYVPVTSQRKISPYIDKGKASFNLCMAVRRNFRRIAIASVFFLAFEKSDLLSEAYPLKNDLTVEDSVKEIDFESYINLGDLVTLKNFDVPVYMSPNVHSVSTKTQPLYAPDVPRVVKQIFMVSPYNEIVEIHEERERNFFLEKGYQLLSVGLIDGYYDVNDVVVKNKELTK